MSVRTHLGQPVRQGPLYFFAAFVAAVFIATATWAAPFAAHVIDARSGEVLYSKNAEARLHPASLTKMMTLYIAFEAIEHGEISADTVVTISRKAAAEPPSKLGLRAGQKIKIRYLIRAAGVKSANDAATALGEAISGSEAAFARRMTRTAQALGMTATTFKNAHGLTESGHLSSAHDMAIMGRHIFYDYPGYYNLFSRITTDAGGREVYNTNRRFLSAYKGADGIKTGFTNAAGFNLVASAERGGVRIIASVFGERSTPARNAKMAELLDLGFKKAKTRVAVRKPAMPAYMGNAGVAVAVASASRIMTSSPRPYPRPLAAPAPALLAQLRDEIDQVVAAATAEQVAGTVELAELDVNVTRADTTTITPLPRDPAEAAAAAAAEAGAEVVAMAEGTAVTDLEDVSADTDASALMTAVAAPAPDVPRVLPRARPAELVASLTTQTDALVATASGASPAAEAVAALEPAPAAAAPAEPAPLEIVSRMSTSGDRHWGIAVGKYGSKFAAEKVLLKTALIELSTLNEALRKVVHRNSGYEATFVGMTQENAALACRRLQARDMSCETFGPSS